MKLTIAEESSMSALRSLTLALAAAVAFNSPALAADGVGAIVTVATGEMLEHPLDVTTTR